MKQLILLFTIAAMLSCKSETKDEDVIEEADQNNISQESSENENLPDLTGTWKRQSYPYGTIQIKKDSIKFETGEGAAEPASYIRYSLETSCDKASKLSKDDYDYVLLTNSGCTPIRINEDYMETLYGNDASGVAYKRQD